MKKNNKNWKRPAAARGVICFAIFAAAAAVFVSALKAEPPGGIPLGDYKNGEPVVRIGVLMKAATATISLEGEYEVVERDSNTTLASGRGGVFNAVLEPAPAPGIPGGKYRVSAGSFKSYEDASFAVDKLVSLKLQEKIVYLDQWYIWFGPYDSAEEARALTPKLKAAGYPNTVVEPVPLGSAGMTIRDSGGKVVYSGVNAVGFQSTARKVKVNGNEYRGDAEITPDAGGRLSVVNLVGADDYLKGVVPKEMPSGAPAAALRSQAIVARAYLLNNRRRHIEDGFELCGTTDCQVYGGIAGEVASTNKAVDDTRGTVIAYGDRIANALFHSTCGGRTANYSDIWATDNPPPYLAARNDGLAIGDAPLSSEEEFAKFMDDKSGNCLNSKYYRWETRVEKPQMEALLRETIPKFTNSPGLDIGTLNDIRIAERSDSGRVLKVVISTTSGDYAFERDTIRWVLGKLKSTMFTMRLEADESGAETYIITGAGWGHSVGLCQMGTIKMAKDGRTYKEILEHYYPGTKLISLWK